MSKRRDGKPSYFHELEGLGDRLRSLPPANVNAALRRRDEDAARSAAEEKRARKAARRLAQQK